MAFYDDEGRDKGNHRHELQENVHLYLSLLSSFAGAGIARTSSRPGGMETGRESRLPARSGYFYSFYLEEPGRLEKQPGGNFKSERRASVCKASSFFWARLIDWGALIAEYES